MRAPTGELPQEVQGRLRLVDYLNPNDQLYFAASKRSVAISDYSLRLVRLPEGS